MHETYGKIIEMNEQTDRIDILNSYHILDSDEDEAFDNLTRIAAKVCDTSISLITLVDNDRQWFKSHYGIEINETSLQLSICKSIISGKGKCLYIEDLEQSEDFKNHPAWTGLGIKFYAGFPIKTRQGVILGSFCVLDYSPKKLSELQFEFLQSMADQAMRLIEGHRERTLVKTHYQDLKRKSELIDRGTMMAKLGGFFVNTNSKFIFWLEGTNNIFDLPNSYNPEFKDLVHPENSPELSSNSTCLAILKSVIENFNNEDFTFSKDFDSESGSCFQVIVRKEGSEVSCIIRDQSSYRKIQRELEKSQNLMLEVEALSKVGGWQIDLKSKEIFLTKNTYDIFDIEQGTPLSIGMLTHLYQGQSLKEQTVSFANALQTGEGYVAERLVTTARHNIKWVRVKVNPILKKGECVRVFGSFQDITEEIKLRKDLKDRREKALSKANYFQSLVDNQSFFILKSDFKGHLTFANEIFRKRYNFQEAPNFSKDFNLFQLINKMDQHRTRVLVRKCFNDPEATQRIILSNENANKESLTIQWEIKAILDSEGMPVEVLYMGQDVSELYEKKSELQNLVTLVSNQNKKLVEYTNIISHNIRSHVANLLGLSNLIDLITAEKDQLDYFMLLKEAIQKLDETIKELNVITKIQQQPNLNYELVNLESLVEKVVSILIGDILNSNAKISINMDSTIAINTVPSYLESIILNLISNAITYRSPERKLVLNISAECGRNGKLIVTFADNGIGIDMEKHGDRIFKLYQTVSQNPGSKGLGLYLVKSQIESMGGEISLESKLGIGSQFTLHLKNG
jgi:signal transduction histidine kinase/PAS domain-containing protein